MLPTSRCLSTSCAAHLQGSSLSPRGKELSASSLPHVRAFHRQGGAVLFLDAPLQALQERLKNDKRRPLLQVPDRRRVIEELFRQRAPLYRAAADLTIDAGAPPVTVARRVADVVLGLDIQDKMR